MIALGGSRGGSADRHLAFPGAVLVAGGLLLVLWALEGWGLVSAPSKGIGVVPKGTTPGSPTSTPAPTSGGGSAAIA